MALGAKYPKPFLVLENNSLDKISENIAKICSENQISKIIVGLPEDRGEESRELISQIKRMAARLTEMISLEIIYEPEAYTSSDAERYLKDHKKYDRNDKGQVDALAATLILEQYIEREGEE